MSLDNATIAATAQALIDGGAFIDQTGADDIWMVITGVLVFFMHAGFAMLEAGNIQKTSVANIMFKNIATVSIGALAYWFFGYAFAFGSEEGSSSFIGVGGFAGRFDPASSAFWFFEMVFAATGATIVSGAVAGRIKLSAYFIVAFAIVAFIYPVVSHWIWATGGWLSAFTAPDDLFMFDPAKGNAPCGTFDFAGSGVVHMVGGVAAFWGALILGKRANWTPTAYPPHNYGLATLGTFFLWFGWYGFNCGSTLTWNSGTGHIAVTTTLSPSAAAFMGVAIAYIKTRTWNLGVALNCVLAGLVGITAGCATIQPGFAVLVGLISGMVYMFGSWAVLKMGIDDPVDAIAVHGFSGAWGVISVALFADDDLIFKFYSERVCDSNVKDMLGWQLLGVISIFAWVSAFAIPLFASLKYFGLLKLSEEEQYNVDMTEHGAAAYEKMD